MSLGGAPETNISELAELLAELKNPFETQGREKH